MKTMTPWNEDITNISGWVFQLLFIFHTRQTWYGDDDPNLILDDVT